MKLVSNVVSEKKLREAQLRGLKLFADTVKQTYGPMGGYTTYAKYVAGSKEIVGYYTKDGFNTLKHIQCDKPIESLIKDDIRTICTQVIKTIGDGTTSATILSYLIFKGLLELQEKKNYPKRTVVEDFKKLVKEGIERIESRKKDCTLEDIYHIAYTSLNGNEDMAKIIQNVYKEAGMGVYIDVSPSNNKDTFVKIYGGMVYNAGFTNPCFINNTANGTCELTSPNIYVFESPIDTPNMTSILKMIYDKEITQKTKLINAGKMSANEMNGAVVICPVLSKDNDSYLDNLEIFYNNIQDASRRPPFCIVTNLNNDNGYLLDIKNMTGATFIKKYIDREAYENDKIAGLAPTEETLTDFAGKAEKVIIDALDIKIINPDNLYCKDEDGKLVHTEFFNNYIASLKNLLSKYEETKEELVRIAELKRRINLLNANMVDLYVGGIGTTDRMSLSDAVEDAVLNCRSAAVDGVVHGANYEGLKAYCTIHRELYDEVEKYRASVISPDKTELTASESIELTKKMIYMDVAEVIYTSYEELVKQIYLPYTNNNEMQALYLIVESLGSTNQDHRKPFNIITEEFDGLVLTSAKTEPAILDSISRIITTLFSTNQFLVPDPRFNIYSMEEDDEKEEEARKKKSEEDNKSDDEKKAEQILDKAFSNLREKITTNNFKEETEEEYLKTKDQEIEDAVFSET